MKKKIVTMLAMCLLAQVCFQGVPVVRANTGDASHPAYTGDATRVETDENQAQDNVANDNETTEQIPSDQIVVQGKIFVDLIAGDDLASATNVQVQLISKADDTVVKKEILLNKSSADKNKETVTFEGLHKGMYQVVVSAKDFRVYEQEVEVKDDIESLIKIYVGGYPKLGTNKQVPGMIQYLSYDKTDLQSILDEMDGTSGTTVYNQNESEDKVVNLLDLQYFAQRYDEKNLEYIQKTATVETFVAKELISSNQGNGTVVVGDLKDILNDEKTSISLKTQSESTISTDSPVELEFSFDKASKPVEMQGMVLKAPVSSTNKITTGTIMVEVVDQEGQTQIKEIKLGGPTFRMFVRNSGSAKIEGNGTVVVDFGGQVAVKKVTLKVIGTSNNSNLVDISKVEFVNDMANRIPAPNMNVPTNVAASPASKEFTVTWDRQNNVTGYEVKVEFEGKSEVYKTRNTSFTVSQFNNDKLLNGKTYKVSVQSTNGEWTSGYSNGISVVPKADKKPDAPDGVSAKGGYRSITVSWKSMKDSDNYNVYYKEATAATFTKAGTTANTSFVIRDLKDNVKYVVYVTGINELGEGAKSLEAAATTITISNTKLPEYKVINGSNGSGNLTKHIKSAQRTVGGMVDSKLDSSNSMNAFGLVDDSFTSYYQINDWDEAVHYHQWQWGLKFTLDKSYQMDRFTIGVPTNEAYIAQAAVYYYDYSQNKEVQANVASVLKRQDENGRHYFVIKLKDPIQTDKVRFGFSVYAGNIIQVSEIRFHEYDSLEKDIQDLYNDDLHLTLKSTVNDAKLNDLQTRLNTKHNGEFHPDKDILQKELDVAKALYQDQKQLNDVVNLTNKITTQKDGHLGVTGLNAWQPLGVSAHAGEEIVIYVGKQGAATGSNTNLQLVATQQHAEAQNVSKVVATLKTGRNEITIPKLSDTNVERGGGLYIQYTGDNKNDVYGVRVNGGAKTPVLNLYGISDSAKRFELAKKYVTELETYVKTIEATHASDHKGSKYKEIDYDYDAKLCILNTTDMMIDQMMFSIPATQVLAGLGNGTTDQKAQNLLDSMNAMDQLMTLYYQHKGLTDQFAEGTNQDLINKHHIPSQHLTIRYAKMFAGAFMYASGNHVGIEWDETVGMVQGKPAKLDDKGNKISGQLFGWGIGHEIGHEINQSQYTVVEVTNNYFAQLSTFDERGVRFDYDKVYERVTSNVEGRSGDVFLQLAMYWQLRLAYDNGTALQTFKDYNEITKNIFFARVDSYARNPQQAPAPKGVALSLTGNEGQNIIRLASAAAEKDLSEFFRRWGLIADAETMKYISQFEKETRAIYYVNDELQKLRREVPNGTTFTGKDIVTASTNYTNGSRVTLNLSVKENTSDVFGYEISRITYQSGKPVEEVVGFTKGNTFVDNAAAFGNRAITYKVKAVDKYLNYSKEQVLEPIKVEGDGLHDKTDWNILSTDNGLISESDKIEDSTSDDPCEPVKTPANVQMIDGKLETVYVGKTTATDAEFIIDFGKSTQVTSVRYYAGNTDKAIKNYVISISDDNKTYKEIKAGTFQLDKSGMATLYFDNGTDPWIANYDARYLKVTAKGQQEIAVAELDVLGPTGDNVELVKTEDGTPAIGKLAKDFIYQEAKDGKEELKIPAGSIVFTGKYKGNPAYNVVIAYDENGNIIGGSDGEANQIILAPDPKDAMLGETSEGRFIYWVDANAKLPEKVRIELYRVNNAVTNEGQRLVSDTLLQQIPKELPSIEFKK